MKNIIFNICIGRPVATKILMDATLITSHKKPKTYTTFKIASLVDFPLPNNFLGIFSSFFYSYCIHVDISKTSNLLTLQEHIS